MTIAPSSALRRPADRRRALVRVALGAAALITAACSAPPTAPTTTPRVGGPAAPPRWRSSSESKTQR